MYNNRTYFLMNVYSGVHLTYTFFFSLQKKKNLHIFYYKKYK